MSLPRPASGAAAPGSGPAGSLSPQHTLRSGALAAFSFAVRSPPPSLEGPWTASRAPQVSQDNPPIRTLHSITHAQALLPYKVARSQAGGQDVDLQGTLRQPGSPTM